MKLFVTAIGTDCGKTVVSAILCEALKASYWKPVQTGLPPGDADEVKRLVSYAIQIHPERHYYPTPVSPHQAAKIEGKTISLKDFQLPVASDSLIVEGAGGVLVPLNEKGDMVIDIAEKLELEIVLVIRLYLGCINHALLSIKEIQRRNITIKGLVFNGKDTFGAVDVITQLTQLSVLLSFEEKTEINREVISQLAATLGDRL